MDIEEAHIKSHLALADYTVAAFREVCGGGDMTSFIEWLFAERAQMETVSAIWPNDSEEHGHEVLTLKGQRFLEAAALAAIQAGKTEIEGRHACLYVANEAAAEALRIKYGDGRLH